jgi:hypothetical protein
MTYSELKQAVQDWIESSESSMVTNIDLMIEMAEKRIYKSVDLNETHKYKTSTLTIGDEFVSLPADAIVIRGVQIIDAVTNKRTTLEQKDISYMDEYVLDRDSVGTPKYYAWYDAEAIILAPSPEAADTVELHYTYRPAKLSASNEETWLSTEHPDLMLNACVLEGAIYNRMEQEDIALYKARYDESIQALLVEENFRNRQDSERFRELKLGAQ